MTSDAIGLAVDETTRSRWRCISKDGGGIFVDARTAGDLSHALAQASEAASDDIFTVVEGLARSNVAVVRPDGRIVYAAVQRRSRLLWLAASRTPAA